MKTFISSLFILAAATFMASARLIKTRTFQDLEKRKLNCRLLWVSRYVVTLYLVVVCLTVALGISASAQTNIIEPHSTWDEHLLTLELHDVHIKTDNLVIVWNTFTGNFLLRSVLLFDERTEHLDGIPFVYDREITTVKDLFDALITTYPSYTYTQDKATGIVWFYPKKQKFTDILSAELRIDHPVYQVSMNTNIYSELVNLLVPELHASWYRGGSVSGFKYPVDLPAGIYSVREIINYCCVANPASTFIIEASKSGDKTLSLTAIGSHNRLVPPGAGAVNFWQTEIGKSRQGIPDLDEVRIALSDPNPRKRWAARIYLTMTQSNYSSKDLVTKSDDSKMAAWAVLGLKLSGAPDFAFIKEQKLRMKEMLTNSPLQFDPGLSLLIAMTLANDAKDASIMDAVADHKFTETEFASIKPEFYQMAGQSALVRNKLKEMKFEAPGLPQGDLDEMGKANIFSLVTTEKN